jgi:hypothetical protein
MAPGYWDKHDKKIDAIIKRNTIRSEGEFYIIRNYLDRFEANGNKEQYEKIDKLLFEYEFKT